MSEKIEVLSEFEEGLLCEWQGCNVLDMTSKRRIEFIGMLDVLATRRYRDLENAHKLIETLESTITVIRAEKNRWRSWMNELQNVPEEKRAWYQEFMPPEIKEMLDE